MLQWMTRLLVIPRRLSFPAALILYDFSAYLTTDLIQPGIIHVVRDFNADVALAPPRSACIWPAAWRYSGCWAALRPYRPSSGAAHRRADLYLPASRPCSPPP
jgi:hypothetical protein